MAQDGIVPDMRIWETVHPQNGGYGCSLLYSRQSVCLAVTQKKQWNFWTGEPLSPLTGKSEGAVARQALDGRSNRAGTLGVTPGATSRDESATDLQSSRQNDSLSGLKEGGKKKLYQPGRFEGG
ncbi:hypothetical protein NQZ68_039203 [Dissostichus eleginoides]|nr:hypothetical protein NQZ68_039203 [Dissostichus eleginoides]